MYNAHPCFSLKNLGKKAHIIHSQIQRSTLKAETVFTEVLTDEKVETPLSRADVLLPRPESFLREKSGAGTQPPGIRLRTWNPEGGHRGRVKVCLGLGPLGPWAPV